MIKENVLSAISEMPENFTIDEVMHKLYVINNHEKAMRDIKNGKVYSTDEVRKNLAQKSVVRG